MISFFMTCLLGFGSVLDSLREANITHVARGRSLFVLNCQPLCLSHCYEGVKLAEMKNYWIP
jgi:hypothetical protein